MGGGGGIKNVVSGITGISKPKDFLKAASDPTGLYATKRAWEGEDLKTPGVNIEDPNKAANDAANAAAKAANAKASSRKKKKGSLLANGAAGVDGLGNSVLANAIGKKTLGA